MNVKMPKHAELKKKSTKDFASAEISRHTGRK